MFVLDLEATDGLGIFAAGIFGGGSGRFCACINGG